MNEQDKAKFVEAHLKPLEEIIYQMLQAEGHYGVEGQKEKEVIIASISRNLINFINGTKEVYGIK